MSDTFDFMATNVHAGAKGSALPVPVDDNFWPELIAGKYTSEGTRRMGEDPGWMASVWQVFDFPHWEMHPQGDELFFLLEGEIEVILEREQGEHRFKLQAGQGCKVPAGAWHRATVTKPGRMLTLTWGKGTQHKPIT